MGGNGPPIDETDTDELELADMGVTGIDASLARRERAPALEKSH